MNEDYENNLYYIKVNRYRYQKDDRTGKRRTYTEWEFYINKELKETKSAGQKFNFVTQFKKWCSEKYNIKLSDIIIYNNKIISLGYKAQRI